MTEEAVLIRRDLINREIGITLSVAQAGLEQLKYLTAKLGHCSHNSELQPTRLKIPDGIRPISLKRLGNVGERL